MKLFALIVPIVTGHICLHSPLPQQNADCQTAPLNLKNQDYCGFKQDMSVTPVEMTAGEVFEVEFRNPNLDSSDESLKSEDQARHGGGFVELSLSYDEGKSFNVIGRYLRTAPDIFYKWPIKIPTDAPEGKALFAWTWFPSNSGGPEMYMDCSVVNISGGSGTAKEFKAKYCPMIEGNIPDRFPERIITVGDGSGSNSSGPGPIEAQVEMNTEGKVVTCEDGGQYDVKAANDPTDAEGLKQQTTKGTGPRRARGPEIADPADEESDEEIEGPEETNTVEGTPEETGTVEDGELDVPDVPADVPGGGLTPTDPEDPETDTAGPTPGTEETTEDPETAPEEPTQAPEATPGTEENTEGPSTEAPEKAPEDPTQAPEATPGTDETTEDPETGPEDPTQAPEATPGTEENTEGPSTEAPDTAAPEDPTEAPTTAGTCDITQGTFYCSSSNPQTSYMCNHGKLQEMPVAAGTQCQCTGEETGDGMCIGATVAA